MKIERLKIGKTELREGVIQGGLQPRRIWCAPSDIFASPTDQKEHARFPGTEVPRNDART